METETVSERRAVCPVRLKASGLMRVCIGVLFLIAVLHAPREAKAQMYCDNTCLSVFLLMTAGTAVIVSADVYYTVQAYAGKETMQSGRNAMYWTSWQAGLLDTLAFGGLMGGTIHKSDFSMGLLAAGSWPLSLTANGMWHGFPNSESTRSWALGMVAFSDIALLSYDGLLLGYKRRPAPALAFLEAFVGTLQLGFGVITAARADAQDRNLAWTLSAIPAAMATHGILALALPKSEGGSGSVASQSGVFASVPRVAAAPIQGGIMMQAIGAF